LVKLGYGSLASWDEAIYGTSARELSRSSNWLDLTYGGIPWFDKPPLNMWVTAFFYKLFGIGEFSVRLFSALCGIGTVLVTYLFASRLFSRWIGFLSALVLVSSSHYLHFARFGQLDSPLTFFISSALYFFWMGRERNRYFIFSGIFSAS
jgi:4-amino-4-deoxy-L-arabinose transferase-like glycosyltransferase